MKKIKPDNTKTETGDVIRIDDNLKNKQLPCKSMKRVKKVLFCKLTQHRCVLLMELGEISRKAYLGNYIFIDRMVQCPGAEERRK